MAVARRRFVKLLLRGAAVLLAPASSLAGRAAASRYVQAVRSRIYPGPVRRLRRIDIRRPGRWGG